MDRETVLTELSEMTGETVVELPERIWRLLYEATEVDRKGRNCSALLRKVDRRDPSYDEHVVDWIEANYDDLWSGIEDILWRLEVESELQVDWAEVIYALD